MIQKRNDDAVHQRDDDGIFKKCLYSEYHLKDDLIFILLSCWDKAMKFLGIGDVLIMHEMISQ